MEKALDIINNWTLTDVTIGEGTVTKVGEIAKNAGIKNAMIVIGGGSVKKHGYLKKVQDSLDASGIVHNLFSGVEPNPSVETIYRIALKTLYYGADGYVGLGGGSVLDACKAANTLVTLKADDIHPYFGVNNIQNVFSGDLLPYIPIPTTSGTSAEVTKYSNVTDHALGVKKLISDPTIIPKVAIVDPDLTVSCPPALTRVVGLDTLTHLMEGYVNNVHDSVDPAANDRAIEGMRLLFRYLPEAIKDGTNIEARRAMSLSCVLGGTVIVYKSTGGPHMNSFSWYAILDHGEATALMLPYYIAWYGPAIQEKLEKIAGLMNLEPGENMTQTVAQGLIDFYKAIGQRTKIPEFKDFPESYIDKAIKDAAQNQMKLDNMPRPIPADKSEQILKTILKGAWDGRIDEILAL